jgi:hypothetical protein
MVKGDHMRIYRVFVGIIVALVVLCLTGIGAAQKSGAAAQKPGATEIPVTSIISDYDSGIAPSLQIQSDKLGAYTNQSTLQSSIYSSGGIWAVSDYGLRNATRTVCLGFSQPIAGTGPNGGAPVSPPDGCYTARIISECNNYGNSIPGLPPGQAMACPMNVHFDYGGKTYDLHMSDRNVNFPETNHINITCIYPTSGSYPCSQWRLWPSQTYIAPDGSTQYRNVANLSYETQVKGQLAYVKQGNFYVSFSIIIMNP